VRKARVPVRHGRDLLLVAGDVDHGATLRAWAPVGVYGLAGHGRGALHLRDLRSTLAPPLPWIVEAAVGVAAALAALFAARRRDGHALSPAEADARATAGAALALAAVVLLTTPLATAAYARLVPLF
jgi:hypothetical protein